MNVALWQLVFAVSIPTLVALIGILFSFIFNNRLVDRIDRLGETLDAKIDRLGETLNARIDRQSESLNAKIDRQTENFNNQVTLLLKTIHDVHVRVVRLEERQVASALRPANSRVAQ